VTAIISPHKGFPS